MSTLTEQFSAARKSQVEAQLNFFQNFSARAVESAGKIAALNMATTRALVAKTESDFLQLLTVKDPRDLFALSAQTQSGFETLLAYGRALAGIASGAQQALLPPSKAAPAPAPQLELPAAPALAPEAAPEAAPRLAADAAEALPAAQAKPIARAASKAVKAVAAKPAAAPFPAVDKPVVVTGLKAVEAAPPPAPASGTPSIEKKARSQPQQQDLLAAAPKARKKK